MNVWFEFLNRKFSIILNLFVFMVFRWVVMVVKNMFRGMDFRILLAVWVMFCVLIL